ncbi:MAG: cobalt ECF transporter T component CbiQ [Dehalococcoidia bacterium]|nr:MAG: cobalt ECF transporter T component CbiQ [Dehalococcoidia bacterium]
MKLGIDQYSYLSSPFHRWDPRLKLIGLIAVIFAFSFVQDLRLLAPMVLVTAFIYAVSKLPFSYMLTRLRYPSLFLLVVVLLLPFLSGQTVVASIGPLDLREEGLTAVLLIATRFICILTVGLVLFGTSSFITMLKAMRSLGMPAVMTDMALLAFRYLYEIGDYLHRMETAMRLRGFRVRRLRLQGLGVRAWLGGSILVRSYERSEWIYKAMIMRGYGFAKPAKDEFKAGYADLLALGGTLLIAAAFIIGDILI